MSVNSWSNTHVPSGQNIKRLREIDMCKEIIRNEIAADVEKFLRQNPAKGIQVLPAQKRPKAANDPMRGRSSSVINWDGNVPNPKGSFPLWGINRQNYRGQAA